MAVILGEIFEAQTNAIETAKFLAMHAEFGELPFDEDTIRHILKSLNDSDRGATVNGSKSLFIHTREAYTLPADAADIEFMPEEVTDDFRIAAEWFYGHLHGIEWIGSHAVSGFGARMFNVAPLDHEEPEVLETAFMPVLAIETILSGDSVFKNWP